MPPAEMPPPEGENSPRVPAVERAFNILGSLGRSGPLSLADIIEQTGLNKSTAYYILRTLASLGAVHYDQATRTYSLGPALIELGSVAGRQFDLVANARRHLRSLVAALDTTIVIYRRSGIHEVVILDRFERDHGVRITVEPGARIPIQGGSFGRAFLAFDPDSLLEQALSPGLVTFTPKSPTVVDDFRRELATVRTLGWAVDHEGFALGVSTVAAPIFDASGGVALVAAAVGFTSLLDDDVVRRYGEALRVACDQVGRPFATVDTPPSPGNPGAA